MDSPDPLSPPPSRSRKRPRGQKDNIPTPMGLVDRRKKKRVGWYGNGIPVYSKMASAVMCSIPASFQLIPILPPEGYQGTVSRDSHGEKRKPETEVDDGEPGDDGQTGTGNDPAAGILGGIESGDSHPGTDAEGHLGGEEEPGAEGQAATEPGAEGQAATEPGAEGQAATEPGDERLGTEPGDERQGTEAGDEFLGTEPPEGSLGIEIGDSFPPETEPGVDHPGIEPPEGHPQVKPAKGNLEIEPGDGYPGTDPPEVHLGTETVEEYPGSEHPEDDFVPETKDEDEYTTTEPLEWHLEIEAGYENLGTEAEAGDEHPGSELPAEGEFVSETRGEVECPPTEPPEGHGTELEEEGHLLTGAPEVYLGTAEEHIGTAEENLGTAEENLGTTEEHLGSEQGDAHHRVTEPAAENLIEPGDTHPVTEPQEGYLETESAEEDHLGIEPSQVEMQQLIVGLCPLGEDEGDPEANP